MAAFNAADAESNLQHVDLLIKDHRGPGRFFVFYGVHLVLYVYLYRIDHFLHISFLGLRSAASGSSHGSELFSNFNLKQKWGCADACGNRMIRLAHATRHAARVTSFIFASNKYLCFFYYFLVDFCCIKSHPSLTGASTRQHVCMVFWALPVLLSSLSPPQICEASPYKPATHHLPAGFFLRHHDRNVRRRTGALYSISFIFIKFGSCSSRGRHHSRDTRRKSPSRGVGQLCFH